MTEKKETISVHGGLNIDKQYGCVSTPIYLSSTYSFSKFNKPRVHDYSRKSNPNRNIVEKVLSKLEFGEDACLTNTGMSAIHLICTYFLKPNDLLIAPHDCYGGSYRLFESQRKKNAYHVKFIDQNNIKKVKDILQKKPKLIFIESPSNPLLRVVDIKRICKYAKKFNVISIVDNTFMTPILQNPLSLGADITLHSCTKYLNGHSDILSGIIITKNKKICKDLKWWANNIGVTGSAFDSYLLLRGIKTLSLRIQKAQENTVEIIKFLKKEPLVKKIYHPSLPENIGHQYALKQQYGFGAILSFELHDSKNLLSSFLEKLNIFTLAESLGGVESLISHPVTMTHSGMSKSNLKKAGISSSLIRLSVGIEEKNDLIKDLKQAFKSVNKR